MLKSRTLLLTLVMSASTFAQSTGTTLKTTSETSLNTRSVLEAIKPDRITYWSDFTGPGLGGQDNPVNNRGEVQEADINTWNQVSFQYNMTDKMRFVVNPRFSLNHNSHQNSNPNKREDYITALDPVIGINGTWYQNGDFTFFGGINSIMPFARTEGTIENGTLFNFGGFNGVSYKLNSRVTVGSWLWGRVEILDREYGEEDEYAKYFIGPNVTYAFNDTLSLMTFYQLNGETRPNEYTQSNGDDFLGIMATIRVASFLTLQPQIKLYRDTDYDVSQGNFNMWLSGRLF